MDEFDPIPEINPVFRGLVVAALLTLLGLALVGMAVITAMLVLAVLA